MPVSAAEVAELRREGAELNLDDVVNVLHTTAEHLGYLIAGLRSLGADQSELLHDIELLIRAARLDRVDLRQARDVLRSLNYDPAVIRLLTALARKAPPPPVRWRHRTARAF
jgi:hypothetical protein